MKEKKRVWFTFNLCEADAFEQYLEKMALQGWFLESVGGAVILQGTAGKTKICRPSGTGKLFPYRRR